jgi:Raf kinase inhibitor-like YbhB/YbcL family protein
MTSATGGARALGGSGAFAGDSGVPQATSGLAGAASGNSSGVAGASGMPAGAGAGGGTSGPFTLTSSAFAEGETIALKYRCRQANVSPALSWTAGPPGTRSYAVTMLHATALHWALYDIPADTRSLPEDIAKVAEPPLPAGSKQVQPNVDGSTWFGYSGPCPGGTALSSYEFFVYALTVETLTDITTASSIDATNAAIQANQLGRAALVGVGRASDL